MKKNFAKTVFTVCFLGFQAAAVFAAGTTIIPDGMTSLAENILGAMTSDFVKVVLACFLCGSAITYAFNKDNEKIKRNALAIGIGAAILIGASSIIDMVWAASSG